MTYQGPERRDDSLRADINALAEQVQALNTTIQTSFVRRTELDEYPDFEIMYARMAVLEARVKQQQQRTLRNLVALLGVIAVLLTSFSLWQQHQRNEERVASEIGHCERVNDLQRQIRSKWQADLTYQRSLVNVALGEPPYTENMQRIRDGVDPLLTEYERLLDELTVTDCESATAP